MSNSKELRVRKCPYKFEPLEDNARIKERFLGYEDHGLVRSVPEGWTLGGPYEKYAEDIYNFELRDDDAWVVTYPKSGAIYIILTNFCGENFAIALFPSRDYLDATHYVAAPK